MPRLAASNAARHESLPIRQASTGLDIKEGFLLQAGVGERDNRFKVKLKLGAGFDNDFGALKGNAILRRMDLRSRLLRDPDARSFFHTDRTVQLVAAE